MNTNKHCYFLLLILWALGGCQNEIEDIKLPSASQAFSINSEEADLILKVTLLDGSYDNILDGASCSSIAFPVTVMVNEQHLVIGRKEDIKYVKRIVFESDSDVDHIEIVFPIKVIHPDYSESLVAYQQQLQLLAEKCIEGGGDNDVECIDFVYPVKVTVYNTNNQVSKVLLAANDKDLHHFIGALQTGELASFIFPLTIQLWDGTRMSILDNTELVNAINLTKVSCDEDDDFDFKDNMVDDSNLVLALINGTWSINKFIDATDQTSLFTSMSFIFNPDGTATITDGMTTTNGTWVTYGYDGILELEIDFGDASPFNKLLEDWVVTAFDTTTISLKSEPDPGESLKILIFKRL